MSDVEGIVNYALNASRKAGEQVEGIRRRHVVTDHACILLPYEYKTIYEVSISSPPVLVTCSSTTSFLTSSFFQAVVPLLNL